MVSKTLVKLTSPFAKSCLVAIGSALIVDAILTIFAAGAYPYLIAYTNELYIPISRNITILYACIGVAAFLLALSTAWASYRSKTNYVLVHSCITGVFLPVSILVYFTSLSSRYKVSEFVDDYQQMIIDYRLTNQQVKLPEQQDNSSISDDSHNDTTTPKPIVKFTSFINLIDSIQRNFACCGINSHEDWMKQWDKYMPPSCCDAMHLQSGLNPNWATLFKVDANREFHYCSEENVYKLTCLTALKDDEKSKFAWLADLIVFLMIMTITNTIVSLLLFGLSKTEEMPYDVGEHELAMVGVSTKPRPSQPDLTGIRHRPSVIALGANKDQIASISQAVRFNLSNSPRGSISGPSKFSSGARRSSSHV